MAKFNPVNFAIGAAPFVVGGIVIYEGYLLLTNTPPFFPDPINSFLKDILGSLGGNGDGNGNGETATVSVDKTIYVAGDTITATGAGFGANETVGCRQTSVGVLVVAKDVMTDASGGFTATFTAGVEGGHITCTGVSSGHTAQALVNMK